MDTRTLAPGHEIHWYRIESVLGQGGFGITYLAHDTNLDRPVAIKEYLPASMAARHPDDSVRPLTEGKREDFDWGLNSFLAEARTLARFRHQNIVGVHSVFEENNTAYMVMAYEQGDSLATLFRQGRCRDQKSLERIFFPIFDGLAEIHRLGFLHRDIKPGNVYIREDGTAVLIDFGSARRIGQQETGEMTALVSQGYTPLEQYSPNYGAQGPWTDVYALAATLFEGITGAKPEEALSRSACLLRRRPDPMAPLDPAVYAEVDPVFLAAVSAGLALQPEERPEDLERWRAVFDGTAPLPSREASEDDDATRLRVEPDEATRLRTASAAAPHESEAPAAQGVTPRAETPRPLPARGDSPVGSAAQELFGSDDLDPPTYRAPAASVRGLRGSKAGGTKGAGGKGGRTSAGAAPSAAPSTALGAVLAVGLVAALGAGAWWWFTGGPSDGSRDARSDSVADASGRAADSSAAGAGSLDPTLIDTLPTPPTARDVGARGTDVERRVQELGTLAAAYREAGAAGASGEVFDSGARAVRAELGAHAVDWHPARHATIVGHIERAAAQLPDGVADRAALQATIETADTRSDLAAARQLLEQSAIVTPVGEALIDKVGRLNEADYRALVALPAWSSMMRTLGHGAMERVRDADFDGASLLLRAALSLQPDEPFMRRLSDHLEGRAGS